MLLKNGFDVNAVTPVGSALHEATLCGKVEVVKILLSEGIDTNLTDCNKRTVMDVVQELNTSVTREIGCLIRGEKRNVKKTCFPLTHAFYYLLL